MAQQTLNLGAQANDNTGDTLRVGGDKINDNFTELYDRLDTAETNISSILSREARTVLTADTTFYVRTDGSDSNDGLTDSAVGAFLTVNAAILNLQRNYDIGGYNAEIVVRAGTYSNFTVSGPFSGSGYVQFTGDTTTPGNVIIRSTTAATNAIEIENNVYVKVRGFKVTTTAAGSNGISCARNAFVEINGAMEYGSTTNAHINAGQISFVRITANYTISGGGTAHITLGNNSIIIGNGRTVTITGTPNFSVAFFFAATCSTANMVAITYSGAVTGSAYTIAFNSAINIGGAALPYFPNSTGSGTTLTGGQIA